MGRQGRQLITLIGTLCFAVPSQWNAYKRKVKADSTWRIQAGLWSDLDECLQRCRDEGHCCETETTSHQKASCMVGCRMRGKGATLKTCSDKCTAMAQPGCSYDTGNDLLGVVNMCGECQVGCRHGDGGGSDDENECNEGCAFYPSTPCGEWRREVLIFFDVISLL